MPRLSTTCTALYGDAQSEKDAKTIIRNGGASDGVQGCRAAVIDSTRDGRSSTRSLNTPDEVHDSLDFLDAGADGQAVRFKDRVEIGAGNPSDPRSRLPTSRVGGQSGEPASGQTSTWISLWMFFLSLAGPVPAGVPGASRRSRPAAEPQAGPSDLHHGLHDSGGP